MAESTSTVKWWDSSKDPALARLLKSVVRRAGLDLPNVVTGPGELPPEFAQLMALCQQRMRNLQVDAIHSVAADVEFVVTNARVVMVDDFHATGGIEAIASSRESRARARRLALVERVWGAEQRVVSATEAHIAEVEGQVAYGLDAIAQLDAAIRGEHRFSSDLTYSLPTEIAVPEDVLEIGLTRVRTAWPPNTKNNEEGAA